MNGKDRKFHRQKVEIENKREKFKKVWGVHERDPKKAEY